MFMANLANLFSGVCDGSSDSTLHPNEGIEKDQEDVSCRSIYTGITPLPNFSKPCEGFPSVQDSFLRTYPQYASSLLDNIRKTEYKRIGGLVYLDYTGASLYPESLVIESNEYLTSNVFGNPHSANPP